MANIKIMVDFTNKKVIHTVARVGSEEYSALLNKGYEKVGTVKPIKIGGDETEPEVSITPNIFWENKYFEPKHKYHAVLNR